MTVKGIHLETDGSGRAWPLVVPRTLFSAYQPIIGGTATLLWLNLYELVGTHFADDSPLPSVARRMGVTPSELDKSLAVLQRHGLLERTKDGLSLHWPTDAPGEPREAVAPAVSVTGGGDDSTASDSPSDVPSPMSAPGRAPARVSSPPAEGAAAAAEPAAASEPAEPPSMGEAGEQVAAHSAGADAEWDSDEAALKAVVAFYHQRIGMLGPSQFEKLRFWVEEQGLSPDVVALAIEETVQSAPTPRIQYLEGILRNWYNDGVRTVADLQRGKRVRASALPPRSEGAPNAAAYETFDPDAVRRWKEMYPDEYDG